MLGSRLEKLMLAHANRSFCIVCAGEFNDFITLVAYTTHALHFSIYYPLSVAYGRSGCAVCLKTHMSKFYRGNILLSCCVVQACQCMHPHSYLNPGGLAQKIIHSGVS